MNKRIRLNGGHAEISIEGFKYLSDETGAFEIPEQYTDELIRIHGGVYDPGVSQLEEMIRLADERVANTKHLLELQNTDAKTLRENLEKYKKAAAERIQTAAIPPKQQQTTQQTQQTRR